MRRDLAVLRDRLALSGIEDARDPRWGAITTAEIERWRRRQALLRTWRRRPDLLAQAPLTAEERQFLEQQADSAQGSDDGVE